MATIIRVNGKKESLKDTSLESLQKAVGGFIEVLTLDTGQHMVLDEEGKIKGKPVNTKATKMTRGLVADDDLIVGDVVICDPNEID